MVKDDDDLKDDEKTLVDWIKEDNIEKVKELIAIAEKSSILEYRDENGLGFIHWAADRGNKDIMELILNVEGLDLNLQDNEGQTALHYACSCGHVDVAKLLIDCLKVDRTIRDNDNLIAEDTAIDNEVIKLFAKCS